MISTNEPIGMIEQCDVSVQDFFKALKEEQENDPSCEFYVTLLLSVGDYQNFILMMRDYKKKNDAK